MNSKTKIKEERIVMKGAKSDDYKSILQLTDLVLVEFRGGNDSVHHITFLNTI